MNLVAAAPPWMIAILALLLLAAAIQDAISLRISNGISLLVAVLATAAMFVAGADWSLWQNVAVLAAGLVLGTFLFGAGWLGGGDVKLLAATGLWFDLRGAVTLLAAVMIAGGILAVVILVTRALPWRDARRQAIPLLRRRGGIPYGVAIATGAMMCIAIYRIW